MDGRGGFIGGGPGWLLPQQPAQQLPPSLLQMAQGIVPTMAPASAPTPDGGGRGGGFAPPAAPFTQPFTGQAGEGSGPLQPGLDINDPNVWHRSGGQYSEEKRAGAANSLLDYIQNTFGSTQGPGLKSSPMTAEAQKVMAGQKFPVDPNRIVFDGPWDQGGNFRLDSVNGPDLFGGRLPKVPYGNIPKELQPLLAPSMVRYYQDQDYSTGAVRGQMSAPWTGFFAPPAPSSNNKQIEHRWPGIERLDPWGRELGQYAALYS